MSPIEKIAIAFSAALLATFVGNSRIMSNFTSGNQVVEAMVPDAMVISPSISTLRTSTVMIDTGPRRLIPHTLWFTYKYDILKNKTPEILYNNIIKSIDAYREVWNNDTNMVVNFLVDSDCTDLLEEVDHELNLTLANIFRNESDGSFKSDLCRLAALYLHGGYYFDIDMEVIQPILLDEGVSFSSAISTLQRKNPGM
jgi:mannosyltransferase OCH1-like enzyme